MCCLNARQNMWLDQVDCLSIFVQGVCEYSKKGLLNYTFKTVPMHGLWFVSIAHCVIKILNTWSYTLAKHVFN